MKLELETAKKFVLNITKRNERGVSRDFKRF